MQAPLINTKRPHLLGLILLISFPSACGVLISPALPAISQFFGVSAGDAQQLITVFIIGYAIGQLIYSPFANRFGRKIAIYLGMTLYFISTIICLIGIYSHSLHLLIFGRLLMALGSSVGMIITFTIIHDYFHPDQARSIIGYTVLSYAVMPAIAIAFGGFITTHFSWIDCFYFYIIYGAIVLSVIWNFPETLQTKNLQALQIKPLLTGFYKACTTWRLVLFSMIYGLLGTFPYIIASAAPFIGINHLGLSASTYGLLFLIPYAGQLLGAITAGKISKRLSPYQVMGLGYASTIFGTLLILVAFILHWVNIFSLIVPIFFIMLGLPLSYSTATVMALLNYPDKATGSAMMSFITMMIILIATFILTLLPTQNILTMPLLFLGVSVAAVIAFLHAARRF